MITNLLNLSLLNKGQTDLVLKSFTIDDVVKEALMSCRADYEHKKLSVSTRVDPIGLRLRTDRSKLLQILTNLVSNAIRYTDQGWIRIEARTVAQTSGASPVLELVVADSGVGIRPEDRQRIFEAFYRGGTPDHEREGMGVGLYIVNCLVRMLGGRIGFTSECGEGSSFTVHLPAMFEEAMALQNLVRFNQSAADGRSRNGNSSAAQGEKVALFLGRDLEKCRGLSENLRTDGIRLIAVRDLEDAIVQASAVRPVAIILEPELSDCSGSEVFQRLKRHAETRIIPVLFFMDSSAPILCDGDAAPTMSKRTADQGKAATKRILITDDDPCMREMLQLALESEGYHTLLASNGAEALALLQNEQPDLMLLDLMMPGLNGRELIDILAQKPELTKTKVLIITGAPLSQEEASRLTSRTGGILKKDELKLNSILTGVSNALGQN